MLVKEPAFKDKEKLLYVVLSVKRSMYVPMYEYYSSDVQSRSLQRYIIWILSYPNRRSSQQFQMYFDRHIDDSMLFIMLVKFNDYCN